MNKQTSLMAARAISPTRSVRRFPHRGRGILRTSSDRINAKLPPAGAGQGEARVLDYFQSDYKKDPEVIRMVTSIQPKVSSRAGVVDVVRARRPMRGGRVLFRVPFLSAMDDADAAYLARTLDLVTHLNPKLHHSPTSPGVVRLDFDSGLFLDHGAHDGVWVLQARTWGHPSAATIRQWQLRATAAAHHLDPTVPPPVPVAAS